MASNRLFRAGLADSDAVAGLSDFAFRAYTLLLLASDDAGRLDGRPLSLRAELFPVGRHADCRSEQLVKHLAELREARLIVCYEFATKPYVQITKVQRYGSSLYSRFPWSDGSHEITYVDRVTRDGIKPFVATSLLDLGKNETPYKPSDDRGSRGSKPLHTGTGTGTGTHTGTGTARAATRQPRPRKKTEAEVAAELQAEMEREKAGAA